MALPAGTVIEAISEKGRTVSFKKSAGTAAGTKTAIEAAVAAAFEKGEYANPDLTKVLAAELHSDKTPITLEVAQAKLKEILDNPKKRATLVKKSEGAAVAAAPVKKTWAGDVQKRIAEQVKVEKEAGVKYNVTIVSKAVSESNSANTAFNKAMADLRAAAPGKAEAAAAKKAEAAAVAAEKKAAREAEAAGKRNAEAAARIAKRLGGPAGAAPSGRNEAWEAEVEEEHERCVAACEATKAEKLSAGRAAYTRKRATKTAGPAGNGAAAGNNSGESLSSEEAWDMFTYGLPADIAAFVKTPKQKAALEKTVQYKTWVGTYAGSKSKGKTELAKYKASIQKAVGKKLAEAKAALNAAGNGASRKRRGGSRKNRGGSRKNRATRKNRSRRNRRN